MRHFSAIHPLPFPPSAARGNALLEYGLIGSLVLIACIFSISSAGATIDGLMGNLRDDMKTHRLSAAQTSQMRATRAAMFASYQASLSTYNSGSGAPSSIQVSGANGQLVQGNADLLMALAAQYEESNPELANLIVKLGNEGKQLAVAMSKQVASQVSKQVSSVQPITSTSTTTTTTCLFLFLCTSKPTTSTSTTTQTVTDTVTETVVKIDKAAIQAQKDAFNQTWQSEVVNSSQYQNLSTSDKVLVQSLVAENVNLADQAIATETTPAAATAKVDTNSDTIKEKGTGTKTN